MGASPAMIAISPALSPTLSPTLPAYDEPANEDVDVRTKWSMRPKTTSAGTLNVVAKMLKGIGVGGAAATVASVAIGSVVNSVFDGKLELTLLHLTATIGPP